MPFDGAVADEELRADFLIRPAFSGKSRDVLLMRRELIARVLTALADRLAGGHQLAACALGETVCANRGQQVVRTAQLLARVNPTVCATQPLAERQSSTSQVRPHSTLAEPVDRLAVEVFGRLPILNEGARTRPGSPCPVGAARTGPL